jgi:1-deoxy-D-xylulose-5-phosphate synthase
MDILPGPLLKNINSPADLKKLDRSELHQVSN